MFFLFLILVVIGHGLLINKYTYRSKIFLELLWSTLFIIVGTFAYYTDDYIAYVEIFDRLYIDPMGSFHLEPSWLWIVQLFGRNVSLFRCSLVALGLLLNIIIVKISSAPINAYIGFFSILCANAFFCWLRQPISMYLFLIGLLILLKKRIWAVFLFLAAAILHKSGIIYILILPIMLIPIKKRYIIYMLVAIVGVMPILIELLGGFNSQLATYFLLYSGLDSPDISRHPLFVLSGKISVVANFILIIATITKLKKLNNSDRFLLRYLFGILGLSLALIFVPFETTTMVVRLQAMGNIICVLLLSKYVNREILKRKYSVIYYSMILMFAIGVLKTFVNNQLSIKKLMIGK